MEGSNHLLIRT